ncbi:hypothetical protein AVEN_6802-1 [Araneus ventricosus]|uniref:HTH psq-type domain-containing protein n=1 Tax=Araneus ventricosus TaxID=182803 RepID=A0A4Y2I731_ARAVE|nr:hypothetical protein AVEN_6802-1 [Araneus ventricosus]
MQRELLCELVFVLDCKLLTAICGRLPRTKKRYECKNERHQWDKSQIVRAISAVKEKEVSVKGAARRFDVPRSALQRFLKIDKTPEQAVQEARLGRKQFLNAELEKKVSFLPPSDEAKILWVHFRRPEKNGIFTCPEKWFDKHPFKNGEAGRAWAELFLARHKDKLSRISKPCGTSYVRALSFNKENVTIFFNL